MTKKIFFDLTQIINKDTIVFPGDPIFKSEYIRSLDKIDDFNLCCWQLGNHTGTHIDYPAHVIKNGKTSSDFSLEYLQGNGVIIDVPKSEKSISTKFISEINIILKNDIVFFKTSNVELQKKKVFSEKFVFLEPEAAEVLIKKGVKIVGIDYLSIDNYAATHLPTHKILLHHDVLIIEGLKLDDIPAGRYHISIAPINVESADGAPVRVFAECR